MQQRKKQLKEEFLVPETPVRPVGDFFDMGALKRSLTDINMLENAYLKCEWLLPTHSHKDRSFRVWIPTLIERGIKEAVISSSGNAAISAVYYTRETDIKLTVFVSPAMPSEKKLRLLKVKHANVVIRENLAPKREAVRFARDTGAYLLRASEDDAALVGYEALAYEIGNKFRVPDAVVVPTSSGATALGVMQGFYRMKGISSMPRLYVVQTTAVAPIAKEFDKNYKPEEFSLAGAITDRVAHRRDKIVDVVKESAGSAFVISNQELTDLREYELHQEYQLGWESLLTIAALRRMHNLNLKCVVCMGTS